MKLIKKLFAASMVMLAGVMPLQASELSNPAALEAFVDGYVKPAMRSEKSPSGTVTIAHNGEVIFAKAYGFQDVEKRIPAEVDKTLFRPGSVSKLFTWVAVMQQVEQGKLDLDTDVNTYLKSFQIDDTWPGQPVTLRHILTHTAGFEDGGLGYLIIEDPERIIPLAEALERYQPYRINPPGKQTAYSNYATSLAGQIVADVSGIEFNQYIQQNIFDVLGMASSSFVEPLPEHLDANMAVAYKAENGVYVAKPYEIVANSGPAGALASTGTDMIKFAQAILNGGELNGQRILQAATTEQMLTRNFSHDERLPGIALGFYEIFANGNLLVGHGGDTLAFHSQLSVDRGNDLAFFVSFSNDGGGKVRSGFTQALYDQFFPVAEQVPVAPADFAERAGKYVGSYSFWRANFTDFDKTMGLGSGMSVAPGADNTLIINGNTYVEVEKNLFKPAEPHNGGPDIAFQENEAGEITGFVMDFAPFMSTYKAAPYQTSNFSVTLLVLSLLIFIGVWLRYFYQRPAFKALNAADKSARRGALLVAAANLAVVIVGAIVLMAVGDRLYYEIPTAFKVFLVLPIIAFVAGLYQLLKMVQVWAGGLLNGFWERVRFTLVALAGLFMCWFYWFWNILGFQYLG